MNPVAETILATPARDVLGMVIRFRVSLSTRARTGTIRGISESGVRVATANGSPFLLTWDNLISIVKGGV